MSQPAKKKDIADFFRPHVRTTPKKRPTPEPEPDAVEDGDEDTIVVDFGRSAPQTPSRRDATNNGPATPHSFVRHTGDRPMATPRSDRRLSIPIRSPATTSTVKRLQPSLPAKPLLGSPSKDVTSQSTALPRSSLRNQDMQKPQEIFEIADSDEDDNESLASLGDILDQPKGQSMSKKQAESRQEHERLNLLSRFTGGRSNPILKKEKMRDLQRREQENRLRISAILQEDLKEEKARSAFAKVNAELVSATKELDEAERADLDKQRLAAILQGSAQDDIDQDDFDRIMGAVERTEAFSTQRTFSFFKRRFRQAVTAFPRLPKPFPVHAIPRGLWPAGDVAARDRAYLSGFLAELATKGKLSDEALRWTFDSITREMEIHLRQSYVDCVLAASPYWTRMAVTPEDIQAIFQRLDADPQHLGEGTSIETRTYVPQPIHIQATTDLSIVLDLLCGICQDLDFACLSLLTSISARLILDQELMTNNKICRKVENLLDALVNLEEPASQQHVHDRLLADLTKTISQPDLQAQFLRHFLPTTPSTVELHRSFAHTFLFGLEGAKMIHDTISIPSSITPIQLITKLVKSHPLFTSSRSKTRLGSTESYATLTSQTRILDAAISNGLPPTSFASRQDEQLFNSDIDILAEHIHSLFVNIADSGASHMRRTEAKETLQALHYRLLYSVRTKTKRKRHVFDPHTAAMNGKKKLRISETFDPELDDRSRDIMSKFVQKRNAQTGDVGGSADSPSMQANPVMDEV